MPYDEMAYEAFGWGSDIEKGEWPTAADTQKYVPILVKLIDKLNERDRKLTALEAAGVDNWEGYDYAMRDEE